MLSRFRRNSLPLFAVIASSLSIATVSGATLGYFETKLVSNVPGLAPVTDPLLQNPWGMSFSATSPFWVSDQASDVATLYSGTGVPQALVVGIPPSGAGSGPTGQVFAGGLGFTMSGGVSPNFIFSTLSGTIDAWSAGTSAVTQFTTSDGAVYTGLAQVGNVLYAADTKNGLIDVFNSSFQKISVTGTFLDPGITAGFTPYNIQNVGGKLYVEYAKRNSPGGFVGVFDANGNLLQQINDSHLNSPWGVTLAPAGFGQFGNDLLVGNFNDGMINAFDPITGNFIGTLSNQNGTPIVNSGLWDLSFRSVGSGFDPNTLFFTAGIDSEVDGLFGEIQVAPEPATLSSMLLALALGAGAVLRSRRSTQAPPNGR
jgi:uncharacterized protein (TIGR03118 family)